MPTAKLNDHFRNDAPRYVLREAANDCVWLTNASVRRLLVRKIELRKGGIFNSANNRV